MSRDIRHTPKTSANPASAQPFDSVEQAWFWFIQAQQARIDGARLSSHAGLVARPCEPIDILQTLDRLYRGRRLSMDHLLVLRHYGRRMMAPDPRRPKEIRAWRLWSEALSRLTPALEKKGILKPAAPFATWLRESGNIVSIDAYRGAAE